MVSMHDTGRADARSRHRFARVEPAFRALAETFVPDLAEAGGDEWSRLTEVVDGALRRRPPAIGRQLVLFVRVLDWLPLFTAGRRFAALELGDRRAFLERMQDSRWLVVRRGVWGLRSVVFLGYYSRPEVHARLGYHPHRDGWDAARARREPS